MGSNSLLQGIFLTQGSNPGLLHLWQIVHHLSHSEIIKYFFFLRRLLQKERDGINYVQYWHLKHSKSSKLMSSEWMNEWIDQWATAIPFSIPTSSSKYTHLPSMNEMCTYMSFISAHLGGLWFHFLWWPPCNLCITSWNFKKRRYTSSIFFLCISWTNQIRCCISFSLML